MSFFADVDERICAMRGLLGAVVEAVDIPREIGALDDADVVALLNEATAAARAIERITTVASAIVSRRSDRDAGHGGIAQSRGHRNGAAYVQSVTGGTRAEAAKQIRVGEDLLDTLGSSDEPEAGIDGSNVDDADSPDVDADSSDAGPGEPKSAPPPWHAALSRALMDGRLTAAQHDAIRRGLGEPPDGAEEAWELAASVLAAEAASLPLEELAKSARTIRDRLDQDGALARFRARHEARSFRMWTDADGVQHAHMAFDDDGALWMRAISDAALRPRRGGPRFVDSAERAAARSLTDDPRTNDQLAYDLVMDLLRAGALAEAADVFGARQPGVRIVHVVDRDGASAGLFPHAEEDGVPVPPWIAAAARCHAGARECTVDGHGNPLDVGREHRLFTPKQRVALAVRDAGCRWTGCGRPASYCEAHHIDEYASGGRTDIDRGILLCRFHHMTLHNGGWTVTREGLGDFLLHPPGGGPPGVLHPPLATRYLWGVDPPPRRFRPAA
ncbi:HNH endonuclease signature motif containing protein [Microbacterium gilvum]|uniref:HNH nuclease domain-containing protein n=1 Tax=Microbacterium gilvum TaxID=1336204 RepID=A0ABP9ADA2_9MICO